MMMIQIQRALAMNLCVFGFFCFCVLFRYRVSHQYDAPCRGARSDDLIKMDGDAGPKGNLDRTILTCKGAMGI